MNALAYFRARQQGLEPDEAADEAGGRDPLASDDGSDLGPEYQPAMLAPDDSSAGLKNEQPQLQTSAPPPPPEPPSFSGQISDALKRARQRTPPPQEIDDAALGRSMQADEKRASGDKLTESIRAAFARQSPNFSQVSSGPSAATKALQLKRQTFDQNVAGDRSEALAEAKLLKPPGAEKGAMTEYQRYKRTEEEEKKKKAAEQLERDRAMLQSDFPQYDLSKADEATISKLLSLRHAKAGESQAKANEALARSQFEHKKTREVEDDAKALAAAIGGDPAHLQDLLDSLDTAAHQADIPGVGPIDKLTPDLVASPEALQARNDMREAVRTMLTMKSGKTVTPQEAADYAKIYGIEGSEEAFRQGVRRLRADISATVRAKKAGFSPEAKAKFEGEGGMSSPAAPSTDRTPTDWVRLRRKDGDTIKARRSDAEAFLRAHPAEAQLEEIR